MITADQLNELWSTYQNDVTSEVRTLHFPRQNRTFDDAPNQLGVMNLSRDSSYRESIVHDLEAAIYRARRMTIEGAAMVDIGACLLYTSPSPRDQRGSRMPSSA